MEKRAVHSLMAYQDNHRLSRLTSIKYRSTLVAFYSCSRAITTIGFHPCCGWTELGVDSPDDVHVYNPNSIEIA